MAANGVNSDDYARRKRRPPQNDQASEHEPTEQPQGDVAEGLSSDALTDARISGRGNSPARAALLQRMQQGYGNRASQRYVQRTGASGTSVQRKPPAKKPAQVAPPHQTEFGPPSAVFDGRIPGNGLVESVNPADMRNQIANAEWPSYVKKDHTWRGWSEITAATAPELIGSQLKNMNGDTGIRHVLTPYAFGSETLESAIEIRVGRIRGFRLLRTDGGKFNVGTQSNTGVSGAGSVTNSTTIGADIKAEEKDVGGAGINASGTTATTGGGTVTLGGQTTTGAELEGSCVFELDIEFKVFIVQNIKVSTFGTITSFGAANAVAALKETPSQVKFAYGTAQVRFPKADCTPIG